MNRFALRGSCAVAAAITWILSPLPVVRTTTDPVVEWSATAAAAAASVNMAPLRQPITFAIMHLAMYDAVNAVNGEREAFAISPTIVRPASSHAAANEAAYRILLTELPGAAAMLTAMYQRIDAGLPDGQEKANGAALGAEVAAGLLAKRRDDGRNLAIPHLPASAPGAWVPTPPGLEQVTTAFLARVTPFTMDAPWQFRPPGPPPLGSKEWMRDFNEVKAMGAKTRSKRTAAQTATALFWEPLAGTVWVPTIHRMAREHELDIGASARFHAAAFAAFADSLIACWDAKFHFNFWRPVTAIRAGAADGHDGTEPDPLWEPLAPTPPFPEYPSGHACATAAVAHTIEDFFRQQVVIPARHAVTGEERQYRRAEDVVAEVAEARMLLGVHFRAADEDGADLGRKIARHIRARWFGRVRTSEAPLPSQQ